MALSRPGPEATFPEWEDSVCRTFVPLRARSTDSVTDFRGQVGSVSLGAVVLAQVAASGALVERTPRLIRQDDPELYKFGLQVSGTSVIEQDGREARLGPGDLAIYDTSRPYRISFADDFAMTVAMFPRHLVRLPEQHMAQLTAKRLAGDTGLGSLIAPLMRGLGSGSSATGAVIATHLGDAVLDLVTAAFAEQMQTPLTEDSPSSRRVLLARVHQFIDAHLHDPELNSQVLADAHFISLRTLQKLFEESGMSVATTIRTRRLERCRRALADPTMSAVSVAQISQRWGFTDGPHFSRLFRSVYGQAPREYRRLASA
jgi:AraC-like DNA-binding protein